MKNLINTIKNSATKFFNSDDWAAAVGLAVIGVGIIGLIGALIVDVVAM